MDSGNSGSLQSSSGGDEEYDSRNESISAFLNVPGHHHHLPPSSHHHHQTYLPSSSSSTLFDPLPNYLDAFSRSPPPPPPSNAGNSLLNLDMVWPRGLRSEPTCTEFQTVGLMSPSSSTQTQPAPGGRVSPFHGSSSMPLHPAPENGSRPSGSSDQTNPVRNSKKRSRASRRAPTTVLTTDTSNFRAMVQEFTGIPAPPFSASPFPRNRFDLFSTASRTSHLDLPPPPYLLRPFAQKFHAPSFASSSSASTTSSNPSVTTSGAATTTPVGSTNNHQLLSDLGFTKQTQSLINMQNPIFTFQSLLQTSGPPPTAPPPRYPLANVPVFGSKSQGSLTMVEDFTMGSHGLPSLVNNNNNNNSDPSRWGDGMGLNDGDQSQSQSQGQLKSFNGNYSSSQQQRGSSSCKMNYSTSALEFQGEKGPENVSSRGEGMVDSWICSSD